MFCEFNQYFIFSLFFAYFSVFYILLEQLSDDMAQMRLDGVFAELNVVQYLLILLYLTHSFQLIIIKSSKDNRGSIWQYSMISGQGANKQTSKHLIQDKDADKSIDNQSYSTNESPPLVQFKKMKQLVHNLFSLAKKQLAGIYEATRKQIGEIGNRIKNSKRIPHNLMSQISEISKTAEYAMPQFFTKLINILVVPKLILKKSHYNLDLSSNNKISREKINISQRYSRTLNPKNQVSIQSVNFNYRKSLKKITINQFKKFDSLEFLETQWPSLEEITLDSQGIANLCSFQSLKATYLQVIDLSNNSITDIRKLKNAELPLLRQLNLRKNKIRNIEGLDEAKFQGLKILNLSYNYINKLNPLKNCTFHELLQLNIAGNRLDNIEVLNGCDFKKLQILTLDNNRLFNLDSLGDSSFYRLKVLSFSHNFVKSLQFLAKILPRKLQALIGHNNKIESVQHLVYCELPQLKQIVLHNNNISDLGPLKLTKFPKLMGLDLQYNPIKPKTLCCFIINDKGSREAMKKYPFLII